MTDSSVHLVKSAQRVLEVLEYFNEDTPSASVTDVSRALSYPQSSTSVLLKCLRDLGYLYYNRAERKYRPTTRAALLGCWAEGGAYRGGPMLQLVDAIAARLGETVLLTSGGPDYAVHRLHVVRGRNPASIAVRAGLGEPVLHSVSGELLLSTYPDPQIRLALHRLNADEPDPARRVNIAAKVVEFQETRSRGWNMGYGREEDSPGTVAIMMPRRKGGDRIVLSVVAARKIICERGAEFAAVMIEERERAFADLPSWAPSAGHPVEIAATDGDSDPALSKLRRDASWCRTERLFEHRCALA